mmetsp:Transcript_112659/g.282175  ORF Transcript_112659/g.282175 Transcript_112659/m.282175 type:complete len:96 (-) Transcript_112659:30-317(-)
MTSILPPRTCKLACLTCFSSQLTPPRHPCSRTRCLLHGWFRIFPPSFSCRLELLGLGLWWILELVDSFSCAHEVICLGTLRLSLKAVLPQRWFFN